MIKIDEEFRSLIPPLTAEEYKGLEESIVKDGCRDALVLWNDTLVDGHNRYQICMKHGIPYQTVQMDFDSKADAAMWMVKNQMARRNLQKFQHVEMLSGVDAIMREEAATRMSPGSNQWSGTNLSPTTNEEAKTAYKMAQLAGVGETTYKKARKVLESDREDLKEQARTGKISIDSAYQQVRRAEKIAEVKQRIEEHAQEQTGVISMEAPQRKYNIIYADPPWKYWEAGNKNQELHYTTMKSEDICKIPVGNLADDNCVLFMWATYPILEKAFNVIRAWGFTYSTAAFVWVKKNRNADTPFIGLGSWTRANSEICLLATKGSILRLDASISQVVESPIEEHSKKPDIVRDLIERLVGKLPRVELFCRHPAEGWDVWGNEA